MSYDMILALLRSGQAIWLTEAFMTGNKLDLCVVALQSSESII